MTAIELMPVAEFPGARGWGYDGVYLSAAQSSYGGPHGLQQLVDAAHARGLAVILDVVYNHVGASGSRGAAGLRAVLHRQARTRRGAPASTSTTSSATPCASGSARAPSSGSRDFHLDGLRLDAIHAIVDSSPEHLVAEVARRVHTARPGRARDRRVGPQRPAR